MADFMETLVFQIFESPEGGFEASAVGYAIHTEGDTWENLRCNVDEATHVHFDQTAERYRIELIGP